MKVFVTGAAGFLGRQLVELLSKKHDVVTVVRPTSDTHYLKEKNVQLVVGDLRDKACLETAMQGVEVVVHAAAALRGKWEDFYDINVGVTQNLLELSVQQKVERFVFISSIIVYDHSSSSEGQVFHEAMPYEEKEQTYYCKTKIAAEKSVNEYHDKHKLPTVILRPAALYGKHGPLFVSRLGLPLGSNRYLVFGKGNVPLALSHVAGVAQAVLLAMAKKEAVGKTYNVTDDNSLTQTEYFRSVRHTVKPKFKALKLPYGLARSLGVASGWALGLIGQTSPLNLSYMRLCVTPFSYSNEKIKEELGWQPQADFFASVKEMMLWHKEKIQPKRKGPSESGKVTIISNKTLKVNVVGCGVISGPHLNALKRIRNVKITALCDPAAEAREKMAKKYGVSKTYSDFKEMLAQENPDVVHVCTPAQSHAEISIEAMKQGCHVLVEKPMAATADEAQSMVNAAKKYSVTLCIDHNHIFDKVMIRARNLLAAGEIGRTVFVEVLYGNSFSSNANSQYMSYAGKDNWAYGLPGALYQNFISHPISLLTDVMGDARLKDVHAKYHRVVPHMKTDELYAYFDSSEAQGLLRLSNAVSPRYLVLNAYGTGGTLRVDFLNRVVFVDKPLSRLPRVIGRSMMAFKQAKTLFGASIRNLFAGLTGRYNLYQGNETLIRLFYQSILMETAPPISPEEGLRSMEIMDEIWTKLPSGNGVSSLKQIPKKKPLKKGTQRSRKVKVLTEKK